MRCKNCGWDNPSGNVKCEKCGHTLSASTVNDGNGLIGTTPDMDFNPRVTVSGCPSCGYPVMPSSEACSNCGHSFSSKKKTVERQPQQEDIPKLKQEEPSKRSNFSGKGTVIQGINFDAGNIDEDRKKLVGFLVTYSHSQNGDFFPLYEGKNFVGTSSSLNISIQNDSKISDKHLSILYRTVDRKFKFKDEQSTNGTFINEELMDEGELRNHDIIRIGVTKLIFIAIPEIKFLEKSQNNTLSKTGEF